MSISVKLRRGRVVALDEAVPDFEQPTPEITMHVIKSLAEKLAPAGQDKLRDMLRDWLAGGSDDDPDRDDRDDDDVLRQANAEAADRRRRQAHDAAAPGRRQLAADAAARARGIGSFVERNPGAAAVKVL